MGNPSTSSKIIGTALLSVWKEMHLALLLKKLWTIPSTMLGPWFLCSFYRLCGVFSSGMVLTAGPGPPLLMSFFLSRLTTNIVRLQGAHCPPLKKIWSIHYPSHASVFAWRLLFQAVPVDNLIKHRGICLPSKCVCCITSHQEETLNHLFIHGHIAASLWSFFMPFFTSICRTSEDIVTRC